ncbi:LOW QUALITY PROTEIN: trichohyalin-like [Denticeps clupeoides]|uniref:LOW QUALITY PROTEIN: trichohyalin-like n=1 Tax=Denticeps clupeoides TaxID=299321 RepID=UPI0010A2E899|nr:LOW QUALITY PROTEIN: trichohyalin-like [Denticeps clupeoides]
MMSGVMKAENERSHRSERSEVRLERSPPDLRIVLLGRKGAGKSAAGSTILGAAGGLDSSRSTEECVKRKADVAGWRVTVVDTPGWEWYYSANGTPAWVSRETARSVLMCPPGPHAILIVLRSSTSVTEDHHRQIEEHVGMLGEGAWHHVMLLFTRGDEMGATSLEQRIRNGSGALRKLLQKCGNRYHVIESRRKVDDGTQVKDLLGKLERMVEMLGGRHYETVPVLLGLEVDKRRRARDRRKKQRQMETQTQRSSIRGLLTCDLSEDLDERQPVSRCPRRLPELRLLLLGERETGKSSAANTILGGAPVFPTGRATEECARQQAEVSGRQVTVVDVPGWEGGPEGQTPERVKREIWGSVWLCPPGPHAILLTLRVDVAISGAVTGHLQEHLKLLGGGAWRHTLLLLTHGDKLRQGVTAEQHVQGGGRELQELMERCGNRYHVISNVHPDTKSRDPGQVLTLLEKVEKLVAGNRCEAFSPLLQEIHHLGKTKNERFNQKLRDLGDKVQRQETELKKLREREVRSLRWFFDRKKEKRKLAGAVETGREEVKDKGGEDRRSMMSELEERMKWLTDDKEKEIQDLTVENDRMVEAINRIFQEKEEAIVEMEEKSREIEDLREKMDEQQVKILQLECMNLGMERKMKEMDVEKKALMKTIKDTQRQMKEAKERYDNEALQQQQETDKTLKEAENRIKRCTEEKEDELQELRRWSETKVEEQENRQKELDRQRVDEINKLTRIGEMRDAELERLRRDIRSRDTEIEQERKRSADGLEAIRRLEHQLREKEVALAEMQRSREEQEEKAGGDLRHQYLEKEREADELRRTVEQIQKELRELRDEDMEAQKQRAAQELLRSDLQMLLKENEWMQVQYEEKIEQMQKETASILETKEKAIVQLLEKRDDLLKTLTDETEKLINLQDEKRLMEVELTHLKRRCEEYKEAHMDREVEFGQLLHQSQDMMQVKEQQFLGMEQVLVQLKQVNHTQNMELEKAKEKSDRMEKQIEESREYYEEKLKEKEAEENLQGAEREERVSRREQEVTMAELEIEKQTKELQRREMGIQEKEKDLRKEEQDLEKRVSELETGFMDKEKQEQSLMEKELEIKHRTHKLEKMENQLRNMEEKVTENVKKEQQLDKKNQEINLREQHIKKREMELKENTHKLQQKKEQLETEEENLRKIQKELGAQKVTLEEQLQKTSNELQRKQEELKSQEQELEKKKLELLHSQQEIERREETLEVGHQEVKKQRQDLKRSEEDLERRKSELQELEQGLKNREENHLSSLQDLEERQKQIKNYENRLGKKEDKLVSLEKVLTCRERDLENKYHDLKRKEQDVEEHALQMKKNRAEMEEKEQTFNRREQDLETWHFELKTTQEELESHKINLHQFEHELAERDQEMKEKELLQKDLILRKLQLERKERDMEGLRLNLEKREGELLRRERQQEEKAQELETRQQNLESAHQQLKTSSEKAQQEAEQMKVKLKRREEGVRELENELHKKQQELQSEEKLLEYSKVELQHRRQDFLAGENELKRMVDDLSRREDKLEKKKMDLGKIENRIKQEEIHSSALQDLEFNKVFLDREQTLKEKEEELWTLEQKLIRREHYIAEKEQDLQNRFHDYEGWETEMKIKEGELEKLQKLNQHAEQMENIDLGEDQEMERQHRKSDNTGELQQKINQQLSLKEQDVKPLSEKLRNKESKEQDKNDTNVLQTERQELATREGSHVEKHMDQELQTREEELKQNDRKDVFRKFPERQEEALALGGAKLQKNVKDLNIGEDVERGFRRQDKVLKIQEVEKDEKMKCGDLGYVNFPQITGDEELMCLSNELALAEEEPEIRKFELEKCEKFQIRQQMLPNCEETKKKQNEQERIRAGMLAKTQQVLDGHDAGREKRGNDDLEQYLTEQEIQPEVINQETITGELQETNQKEKHTQHHITSKKQMDNKEEEVKHREERLEKKARELEEWEKYLYNWELCMVNWQQDPVKRSIELEKVDKELNHTEEHLEHMLRRWTETEEAGSMMARRERGRTYQDQSYSNMVSHLENLQMNPQNINHMYQEVGVASLAWDQKTEPQSNVIIEELSKSVISTPEAPVKLCPAYRHLETEAEMRRSPEEEEEAEMTEEEHFYEPSFPCEDTSSPELRLVLLGEAWCPRSVLCRKSWPCQVAGRKLTVMEPAGLKWRWGQDGGMVLQCVSRCPPGPHVFLLVIPSYLTFTSQFRRAVESSMKVLGDKAWQHTIVVFTWGETLSESMDQRVLRNGDLQWLLAKCGGRYHILNNSEQPTESQVTQLVERVEQIVAGNGGHYYVQP